jgi:TolA-binding protein
MAVAQERGSSGNFLDNLFNRGEQQGQQRQAPPSSSECRVAQGDPGDLTVRLDRMENVLRQLTGTIENLQYRSQQLEMQLKRMQDDTEYRFQQLGSKGSAPPPAQAVPVNPGNAPGGPPANPGRRSDVFDPSQRPNAPGAPRVLGNQAAIAVPEQGRDSEPVGAPGGRAAGAPLDLATMAGNRLCAAYAAWGVASAGGTPVPAQPPQVRNGLPPRAASSLPRCRRARQANMTWPMATCCKPPLAEQAFSRFSEKASK